MLLIVFAFACGGSSGVSLGTTTGGTTTGTTSSNSTTGSTTGTSTTGSTTTGSTTSSTTGTPPGGTTAPLRIYVVVFENRAYSEIVGNSAAPFLNSLATQYTLATNYYANTHPSIGNYFMMTTGEIVTNDDSFNGTVTAANLARSLDQAGKSWKVYAESLPASGYTGGNTGLYLKRHNPFAYLSDVVNSPAEAAKMVPFSQFSPDLGNGATARFNFIVPNAQSDMHDCPPGMSTCTANDKLAYGDDWLKSNLTPLLNSADFKQNGILVVAFDESVDTDSANGGGHIAMIFAGPLVKSGFNSGTFFQHQNLLGFICDELTLSSCPGQGAAAAGMQEALK